MNGYYTMIEYNPEIHQLCFPFLVKAEAEKIFSFLTRKTFSEKSVVMQPGDVAGCCYFLMAGKFAVQQATDFVGKTQVVGLLDPGAPVGEAGLLPQQERVSTVVAVIESEVLELSQGDFVQIKKDSPELALKIMEWLLDRTSRRLQKNSERLAKIL